MSIAYYNGDFCDFSDVKIPLTDRCVFFGDGIYDAAIGKNGFVYLEKEHLDRFFGNAERLNIRLSVSRNELSKLLSEIISRNGFEQYFLYFQLSRTSGERTHSYSADSSSSLLITAKPHHLTDKEQRLKLITAEDIRYKMCNVKTLNLLPAVIASKKAEELGCDEAVFIRDGIVTECAHSNVFIIKDETLYTHPEGPYILPGITRKRVLYLCDKLGIEYREKEFTKNDLVSADDVLITSTSKLCVKTKLIDGIEIAGKSAVADAIIDAVISDFSQNVY